MLFVALALTACATPESGETTRLESLRASDGTDSWDEASYEGLTTVTGEGRDWALSVDLGDGTTGEVDVHAPGASDLSVFNGVDVATTLGAVWGSNPRDVEIDTVAGDEPPAPMFVAQVHALGLATDAFGEGFVDYGDAVGTGTIEVSGAWGVEYHDVVFQTDDGEVVATAGAPVELTIDGATWRAVVHTAFVVTDPPEEVMDCGGGASDTLSFEMIYEPPAPKLDGMEPQGTDLAGAYSCG